MNNHSFSFRKRLKSFYYAFNGVWLLLRYEPNAWIHAVAAIVVILAGFFFHISSFEWCFICFAIGSVIVAEGFNTAIEKIADLISPEYHPIIKQVKDIAAGCVLITAIAAACVGLIIFLPKVFLFF